MTLVGSLMRPLCPFLSMAGFSLRPIRLSDADDWFAYLSIPQVVEHTSWNIDGPDDLRALIDSYLAPEPALPVRFALQEDLDGRLLGSFGFNPTSLEADSIELAYDLHPSLWGRGFASACAISLVGWASTTLGRSRVLATVLDTNSRSIGVLERTGFHREGKLSHHRPVRGELRDFWLYGRTGRDPGS